MLRFCLISFLVLLIVACTSRNGVRMDLDASNTDSAGRLLFSHPF